ncbi:hypothetical protein MHH81_15380 [Psychrobacillus sp. FSL H8-0484]
MEKKKQDGGGINKIPPKATQTATKKDIQQIFEKAVRTHGKTLERLSKN